MYDDDIMHNDKTKDSDTGPLEDDELEEDEKDPPLEEEEDDM